LDTFTRGVTAVKSFKLQSYTLNNKYVFTCSKCDVNGARNIAIKRLKEVL